MAIQTVYYRQKIEGTGWRYRPLTVGRRPEGAKNGPYFIRVRDGAGKCQWVKHDKEQAAEKAAKAAPVARIDGAVAGASWKGSGPLVYLYFAARRILTEGSGKG